MLKINKYAFSLIEIMVWILIVSILMTGWFYALTSVNVWKIKLIESTNMEKEMFYFSEKLYEIIKKWWVIDYEEYFNRQTFDSVNFTGWRYTNKSWFWNGTGTMWYCISPNGASTTLTWWCITSNNTNLSWVASSLNLAGSRLIYGQYGYQFVDYNSNMDSDKWDEDWNWNIYWDLDDEFVWLGPSVFSSSWQVFEVYLINGTKTKRTFFRWNVISDSNAPVSATCTWLSTNRPSWSGCLWTIQMLKLVGKDWWYDHTLWTADVTENDWVIDTWVYDKEFYGINWSDIVADRYWTSNSDSYWVSLFPDTISVMNVEFFLFPNKDIRLAWKDFSSNINMAPYVRLKFSLSPSWKKRKWMKWNPPSFDFTNTLSLTDIFSK